MRAIRRLLGAMAATTVWLFLFAASTCFVLGVAVLALFRRPERSAS